MLKRFAIQSAAVLAAKSTAPPRAPRYECQTRFRVDFASDRLYCESPQGNLLVQACLRCSVELQGNVSSAQAQAIIPCLGKATLQNEIAAKGVVRMPTVVPPALTRNI
jgi:hypothetical protein